MNQWSDVCVAYAEWLRTFPMLVNIGQPGESIELVGPSTEPAFLDSDFWSERTHATEGRARLHLTESEIDGIFEEVARVIDEDLSRFDPLVAYYGKFEHASEFVRMDWERDVAHSVKRDLAWAGVERAIGETGFFSNLLHWYGRGRWPMGWAGEYPNGHLRVV